MTKLRHVSAKLRAAYWYHF